MAAGAAVPRLQPVAFRAMARRALPLALLAALAVAGCGLGDSADITPEQRDARVAFIKEHRDFDDHGLARLCPGLYPRDFLTNEDDYPEEDRDHRDPPVTAADRAAARAAGCDVPSPK